MSLAFGIGLGLACGLIFGAAPALQLARIDPQAALRSGATATGRSLFRNILMGAQAALALVVLVAGGLFVRSLLDTRGVNPGFRQEGVLLAAYDLTGRGIDDDGNRAFVSTLVQRLRTLPSVAGRRHLVVDAARHSRAAGARRSRLTAGVAPSPATSRR